MVSKQKILLLCAVSISLFGFIYFLLFSRPVNTGVKSSNAIISDGFLKTNGASFLSLLQNKSLSSVLGYCNPEGQLVTGKEGLGPKGYNLKNVHIVIRHGDRGPMSLQRSAQNISCDLQSDYLLYRQFKEYIKGISRDEHSFDHFKGSPYMPKSRHCKAGDLTKIGVLQHLKNGKFLHKRYVKNHNLLDGNWEKHILLKSTKPLRVYQSLIAILFPLLPNFNVTRLNVVKVRNSGFCAENFVERCDCIAMHLAEYIYKNENSERLKQHRTMTELVQMMVEIMNLTVNYAKPHSMLDQTMIYLCHGHSIPCKNGKCIQPIHIEKLLRHYYWNGGQLSKSYAYQHFSALKVYPLMLEIAYRLGNITSGQARERLVLYSGHDVTLAPLLSVLGVYDGTIPPYASRLILELYTSLDNNYYLRILYNGRDVTKNVKFCKNRMNDDRMCPLHFFTEFISNGILENFNEKSYNAACMKLLK